MIRRCLSFKISFENDQIIDNAISLILFFFDVSSNSLNMRWFHILYEKRFWSANCSASFLMNKWYEIWLNIENCYWSQLNCDFDMCKAICELMICENYWNSSNQKNFSKFELLQQWESRTLVFKEWSMMSQFKKMMLRKTFLTFSKTSKTLRMKKHCCIYCAKHLKCEIC